MGLYDAEISIDMKETPATAPYAGSKRLHQITQTSQWDTKSN